MCWNCTPFYPDCDRKKRLARKIWTSTILSTIWRLNKINSKMCDTLEHNKMVIKPFLGSNCFKKNVQMFWAKLFLSVNINISLPWNIFSKWSTPCPQIATICLHFWTPLDFLFDKLKNSKEQCGTRAFNKHYSKLNVHCNFTDM